MPRIAGVDVPSEKRIEVGLQYIFGVGPFLAKKVLKEAGINPDSRAKSLTEDEVARIARGLLTTSAS